MQRGTAEIILGMGLLLIGVVALKVSDRDFWWLAIALGGAIGAKGGISISERSRI